MSKFYKWKRKNLPVCGVDTETYNDPSFGLKSIQVAMPDDTVHYFTTDDWSRSDLEIRSEVVDKFVDFIKAYGEETSAIFAFFNLKFDFSQMVCRLLQRFQYTTEKGCRKSGMMKIVETDLNIYKVELYVSRHKIEFIDISNFLTGGATLDQACKDWIKRGKVGVESKDFLKAPATDLERSYAMEDARLTRDLFVKLDEEGVVQEDRFITIASRTMTLFKEYCNNRGWNFDDLFYHARGSTEAEREAEREEMRKSFELYIRPSTRGGIVMANRVGTFRGCDHYDMNSMHPTQAHLEYTPCGGLLDEKPNGKHTYIIAPNGWFKLKEKHVPNIQWKTKMHCNMFSWLKVYEPSEYVEDFYLNGTYWIWEDEWEIVKAQYDYYDLVDGKYVKVDISGYEEGFRHKYMRYQRNGILRRFIDHLYEGKKVSKGTKRYYYKILLNALYGKFMSRPDGVRVEYETTADGFKRKKVEETDRATFYLPLGSWIAMKSRCTLMRAIMSIPYDDFYYCDTDSIICRHEVVPDITLGSELGEWKLEAENVDAHIVGPKCYQELFRDGSVTTKCAGLSRDVLPTVPFGELAEGRTYTVLKARRDPITLAINLVKTEFTVSCKPNLWRSMA